jgi:HEAT repeat protein
VLALDLPHSELLVPGLLFLIIGIGLIAIAKYWPESSAPVVTAVWPVKTRRIETSPPSEAAAGAEQEEVQHEPLAPGVSFARTITWPGIVDPDAGRLSPAERLRVIEGLGIAGDAWCAGVLRRAFEEEDDDLRVAAVEALGSCSGDIVAPTLERAYASHHLPERYAAVDGASRRADIPLLERALQDSDATVALAAAYGLQRAKRPDLVDSGLADRTDPRAAEIRRVLPMLG